MLSSQSSTLSLHDALPISNAGTNSIKPASTGSLAEGLLFVMCAILSHRRLVPAEVARPGPIGCSQTAVIWAALTNTLICQNMYNVEHTWQFTGKVSRCGACGRICYKVPRTIAIP